MSNMEDLDGQLSERERQKRVYDAAMAELARQRQRRENAGLGIMAAWGRFGARTQADRGLGKLSSLATKFCIGFAFLTPCLLFARYML